MEQNYRISFKIGESSFEIESTDLKWLESKEKDYFQRLVSEAPKHRAESQAELAPAPIGVLPPGITLVEFYRRYVQKLKSRVSIAVFFIYYLQKLKKKDKIKSADVTHCFKEIGYPNWNKINMADTLKGAKHRALLNCVNKLWSLTTTGEDYVFNSITGKAK